jgi:rhodanese-related sulfurtransferase
VGGLGPKLRGVGTLSDPGADLSPERVAEMVGRGEAELIDVRERYEREAGRIESSRHIEMERLASEAETVPRDRPVVFQCRLGARSAMATQAFRAAGYDAYNLDGGIQAWVDSGLPIVPQGGYVADH